MLEQNSYPEFKELILEYGGRVLWENDFKSWTDNLQKEMITYLWGFIIYTQTSMDYLQPCWVACEHETSMLISRFLEFSKSRPYSNQIGGITHTVLCYLPRYIIKNLRSMKEAFEVHKSFITVPDYRMFRFLNHIENQDYGNNDKFTRDIVLSKMRKANMKEFVPTVKFVYEPEYFKI